MAETDWDALTQQFFATMDDPVQTAARYQGAPTSSKQREGYRYKEGEVKYRQVNQAACRWHLASPMPEHWTGKTRNHSPLDTRAFLDTRGVEN